MMPVYCATHIWTSPLAATPPPLRPRNRADLLSIDAVQLRSITGAMTLGYIIPTILPALPSPSWISAQRQEVFLALWQFFPLWVSLWQFNLGCLVRFFDLVPASAQESPESRLKYGRRVYRYILAITSVLHFAPILYTMFPQLRSAILPTVDHEPVNFRAVFKPMSVFSSHPVGSIAEGSQSLLQYDMYCSLGAALLWTAYLSCVGSGQRLAAVARTVFKSMVRILVVGPGGAVLWALWDRDEEALNNMAVKEKI